MNKKRILITGGSGSLGRHLSRLLLDNDYQVCHLSRERKAEMAGVTTYLWDVAKNEIDEHCLDGVHTIVHLAGAGIADKRWTDKRKKLIIDSRVQSIGLLYNLMASMPHSVQAVVSASGIGYYSDRGNELLTENSAPAHDFLGQCCVQWEAAVDKGKALGLSIAKFRTGIVLDKHAGALPQLAGTVKWGVGAPLGSGNQWMPWIHWEDVARMYFFAIEHELQGVYNMCAPNPVTNSQLTAVIAKTLHRPLWLPHVPAFALKALLGEMATLVLGSTRASAQKIIDAGFEFKFSDTAQAVKNIYEQ